MVLIRSFLEGVEIGIPTRHNNLVVFPLFSMQAAGWPPSTFGMQRL